MAKEGAIRFFPTDLANDLDPLTMEERGMYLTYMRQAWPYGGPVPVDEVEAVIGRKWAETTALFQRRFTVEDQRISLLWMEKNRAEVSEFRARQSMNGAKGGRGKRSADKGINPGLSSGLPKQKPKRSPRVGDGIGYIGIRGEEHTSEIEWPSWAGPNAQAKWLEFCEYRRTERKKPYASLKAEQRQINLLGRMFEQNGRRIVAAVSHTIDMGWLFPPDPTNYAYPAIADLIQGPYIVNPAPPNGEASGH